MKGRKQKSMNLIIYYTNPQSGAYRELFYCPEGSLNPSQEERIKKNAMKYCSKNNELDFNYPFYKWFPATENVIETDKRTMKYLRLVSQKLVP